MKVIKLYYTIYKTTCLINGKFYIGKHQTKNLDDGYLGSGKLLMYAMRKYGIQYFVTEIIAVYQEEWRMNLAERILVVLDLEISYNLCKGGHGGFGYINRNKLGVSPVDILSEEQLLAARILGGKKASANMWSPENKEKTRLRFVGDKNSQFGKPSLRKGKKLSKIHTERIQKAAIIREANSCWIVKGEEEKKIKINELDKYRSEGWKKGRPSNKFKNICT
jgi:hypothetical protein